jgi:hypothetical protein
MFHRPHCRKCENAFPEFIRASKEALGMVRFGELNVDEIDMASRLPLSAVPDFMIFHPDGHDRWDGYPSWRSMVNAAIQYIPDRSVRKIESWASEAKLKAAILFSNKPRPPPLWAAISGAFGDVAIRIGWTNVTDVFRVFGVEKVPVILLIDGERRLVYGGEVVFGKLKRAIEGFFAGSVTPTPVAAPTPRRVLARHLTNADVFDAECGSMQVYCVVVGGDTIDERVEELAHLYERYRIRFFACGQDCPMVNGRKGVWVIDHTGDGVIRLETIDGIEAVLDCVVNRTAVFERLPKTDTLSDL